MQLKYFHDSRKTLHILVYVAKNRYIILYEAHRYLHVKTVV